MTPAPIEAHRGNLIGRYPIPAFFVIAYAFSWTIGGLLVADRQGALSVPQGLHYISAFGPAIAALIVTAVVGGRAGLADLLRRIVRADVGGRWWLIGLGVPLALGLVAVVVYALSNGALPELGLFGTVDYLGDIGVPAALALWIATYGFGEEIGWRGFAFHRMASGGWLQAAALIGVLWGYGICHTSSTRRTSLRWTWAALPATSSASRWGQSCCRGSIAAAGTASCWWRCGTACSTL